jgi:multiple sugar transport system substrate-binding protein
MNGKRGKTSASRRMSRRQALATLAAGGALAANPGKLWSQTPAVGRKVEQLAEQRDQRVGSQTPAVRRKVELVYWAWADNPMHQRMSLDAVDQFNKSQGFISVQIDAGLRLNLLQRIVVAAYDADAGPDLAGTVQTHVQDWFDSGVLHPIDEFFNKWDQKADYFPSAVEAMRGRPGQPVLYAPVALLPYVLYYRADWFDEAKIKPPSTYDEFIAAAKTITRPDRIGYALSGLDYFAVQPIWASAGVKIVDDGGKVDFDSAAAVAVTEKWLGMYTKDKSAQPTAVNDRYPQLFALMEQGKAGMWIHGTQAHPRLNATLGEKIQVVPTPNVGSKPYMLANPEGLFMLSSCKEKEAAWEFMKHMSSGDPVRSFTQRRGLLPVRKSLAAEPAFQDNRFFKVAIANAVNWWTPPFARKNWTDFQDTIGPYWQQALRQEITAKGFHDRAAKFLRGEA